MNANNPLLLPWTGPMAGAPPLDEVTTPLLEAALEAAMLAEDEELARLRNVDGPSTFENTVKVLDGLGDDLDRVVSIYSNFCLSFSTPELRARLIAEAKKCSKPLCFTVFVASRSFPVILRYMALLGPCWGRLRGPFLVSVGRSVGLVVGFRLLAFFGCTVPAQKPETARGANATSGKLGG